MDIRFCISLFLFAIFLLTACVSPVKYEALLQENEFLKAENNVFRDELKFSSDDHLLEGKLEADVNRLKIELQNANQRYAAMEKSYLELSDKYNWSMQQKGSTTSTNDVGCQSQLSAIRRTLDQQNNDMRIIQMSLQQKEMQVKDLERLLAKYR